MQWQTVGASTFVEFITLVACSFFTSCIRLVVVLVKNSPCVVITNDCRLKHVICHVILRFIVTFDSKSIFSPINIKMTGIQESYNTPLEHTPGNLPSQLWKESLDTLLVKVQGCVPKVCWNKLIRYRGKKLGLSWLLLYLYRTWAPRTFVRVVFIPSFPVEVHQKTRGLQSFVGLFTSTWGKDPIWHTYFSSKWLKPLTRKGCNMECIYMICLHKNCH